MHGLGGCSKNKKHPTSLKPSHGRLQLNERFMPHHLVLKDKMELLELAQGDGVGSLVSYVQNFNRVLTMVPLKE